MTDLDLIAQINSTGEFLWSLIQYWTSISIGILIGAHFVAKRLNSLFLGAFLVAYFLFTTQIARLMSMQVQVIKGLYMDLLELKSSAVELSHSASAVIEYSPIGSDSTLQQAIRLAMLSIMFLVTVAYPIYCKRKVED